MIPSEIYKSLEPDRRQYETRAEEISGLTLPYIFNETSFGPNTDTRYELAQSFNGMLVNNLKAKIGMALLPPSTSSFRLKPDPVALLELFGKNTDAIAKLNEQLSVTADAINSEIERQQIRSDLFDMIAQLIIVGSVVIEKVAGKGVQIYPLRSFVAELDNKGNPFTLVIKEVRKDLPDGITVEKEQDEYNLYTMAKYNHETKKWDVTQDIDGLMVGKPKSYTEDKLPFKYLGWTWNVGDRYHRPFAEDYMDDMAQVNKLAGLNTQGAVMAGKALIFVDQRGNRTRMKDVAESANGDVVNGRAEDVTAFQLNKNYDYQVSNAREQEIMKNLKQCFLDSGSVTRDAERVTAQEIRVMAQQLESSTLAGIYSKMSLQWSKWIVEQIMSELKIKFDAIDVAVLTGLDALGRSQESQKLDGFIQRMTALGKMDWINESEMISRYASYEGINVANLVKSPEEVAAERQAAQQAAQQQAMMQAGAESIGQSAGPAIMGQ